MVAIGPSTDGSRTTARNGKVYDLMQPRAKSKAFAILRIAFGLVWAVDAWFKWQPAFLNGLPAYLSDAMMGQPAAIQAWINFWIGIVAVDPHLCAILIAIAETTIAVALIFGALTDIFAWAGIILSLVLWTAAEGFGGPYASGSTDIGAAIIYAFVFAALLIGSSSDAWSIDAWLRKKYPSSFLWKKSREANGASSTQRTLAKTGLGAIIVLAVLFFAAPASYSPASQTASPTDPNTVGMGVMPGMALKEFDLAPNDPVPTVDFTVEKDPVGGGWNLHIITTNFVFTPQNEDQAPVADEGHAHLYIDGTLSVVYGPWYHFDDLPLGEHTIVVTLNANDHSVFAVNGTYIKKIETITQG